MDEGVQAVERPVPNLVKSEVKRDAQVEKMMVGIRNDALVAEMFAEKTGDDPAAIRASVKKVRKRIAKRANVDLRDEIGMHLTTLDALYAQATTMQDLKTALSVEKERGKTLSLYNKIQEQEAAKVDREKEETRRILQAVVDKPVERLDDLARAVVNQLIDAETRK